MGITTVLETESRERLEAVEDPTNVLHRILPDPGDLRYQCLGFIDRYGDTVFNYLQVPRFLDEWATIDVEPGDSEARRVVDGIRKLAEKMQDERHLYLRLIGD